MTSREEPDLHDLQKRTLVDEIVKMVEQYTADIPRRKPHANSVSRTSPVILLTGGTGSIGAHILSAFLAEGNIGRVYLLHRSSSDCSARTESSFRDRLLPVEHLVTPKLVHVVGNLSQDRFGLGERMYEEVRVPSSFPTDTNLGLDPSFRHAYRT